MARQRLSGDILFQESVLGKWDGEVLCVKKTGSGGYRDTEAESGARERDTV